MKKNKLNRYIYLYIVLLLSSVVYSQNTEEIRINKSFNNAPLKEVVDYIETISNINIYYKKEWIDSVSVSISANDMTIDDFFNFIFVDKPLGFLFIDSYRLYILPDKKIISQLPDFSDNKNSSNTELTKENITEVEQKYLKGRKPDMVKTIIVGKTENRRPGKSAIISGVIIDSENSEPLIGATIYIKELKIGAATDAYGSIRLSVKPGKYSAQFQSLGMSNFKCLLDIRSDGYFRISMVKEATSISEITVNGQQQFKRGAKLGLEKVSIKSIKQLPTLMGEKDIIRVSQMLPGIVSVGEGSSGLNVRGGNADQNLFYINKIPIYNSSHLFGFFSAFNSSIINNFSIYKGHVPANYGGRLSSIFNIETRKGNKNKFFAQGGISPISANIAIEIPVIKEKLSVVLSGRSTYSDWILKRINEPSIRNSTVQFYDLSMGIDYRIDDKNQINIFGYYSYDFFSLNQLTDYDYSNLGSSIDYLHSFSPAFKLNLTGKFSNYNFNTIEKSSPSEAYQHDYNLQHNEFGGKLSYILNDKHVLNGGVDLIYYDLDRGIVEPYSNESFKTPVDLGVENGVEASIFIDDKFRVNSWLDLYMGFRFNHFIELGPKTVYNYRSNESIDKISINDTIFYENGEAINNYSNPEIRAAIDIKINSFNSIKFSITQMHQYLFMLSNTISVAPNDQWKMVDQHITPPKSTQYSIGYSKIMPYMGVSFTGEAYFKNTKNAVEYKDGIDFLSNPNIEQIILQGDQRAYGFELMLSKDEGAFGGWISYTYSRSLITVDGENEWDKINNGIEYPSNYDKPHVLNIVGNYKITRRFAISSNIAYSTGRPVTLPQGSFYIDDKPYVNYSSRNSYRIPDYFRVDLSLTIDGNLKANKLIHSYWVIGVYNMLGRNNVNSIYFRSEDNQLRGYKYSVIGAPIFTVSWNLKLGNYDND